MASTGDLSVANGVMRIVGGKLTKQYEEVPLLHNRMQKGRGTKISDRGVEIPTHLSPNPAHKFMGDGDDFPAGGSNAVKRAQVFFKNYAFSTRMTGAAIDSINSLDTAYIKDWLQFNLDETMSTGYKFGNYYAWGKGDGALAVISTGANSATQTVSNNLANSHLRDGLVIDSVTTATGLVTASNATILNAKASSTTFTTVAAMTTTVTSDVIVASFGYNLAVTGMAAIIDDTTNAPVTFQGLSRNTYPIYRANRVAAGTASVGVGLDVSHLRRILGAGVHISVGELNRDALEFWSHPSQWSAYTALGWQLKRFTGNSTSVDLGFQTAEWEGINWIQDVDAPKDQLYMIDWSTMGKYVAKDFGWDDKTGSILRQVPSSTSGIAYTDQYEAYWTGRYNYGCTRPNKNGVIDYLAVPTGF